MQDPSASPRLDWAATSVFGRTTVCTQRITVVDEELPSVICPEDAVVSAGATCEAGAPDLGAGTVASDNCTPAGALQVVQSPAPGTPLGLGVHIVEVAITDLAGNTRT